MFESLSGTHGAFDGAGADWLSQMVMPSQKAGWSWKFHVVPLPSCFGGAGGSFGSTTLYSCWLPDPGRLDRKASAGSSWPVYEPSTPIESATSLHIQSLNEQPLVA